MIYRILLNTLQILLLSHFVKSTDLFCQKFSPLNGSCLQCNQNFTFNQSQGVCVSDCDQNLYFETDSQQCVPSCKQNEFGDSNQGVCQEIYQCPILVDLGQDFHSGLASQIIVDDTNQIIISISNTDTNIKLWNQVNGILKTTFSGHTQPVLKIYLLQDSNQLLSFSSNGEIFYWNYSTGVLNKQQTVNLGQLTSLSYVSLEYGLITLYGYQGEFYIYNIQTQISKKYVGHTNLVLNSIIINPSSFITYSLDKSIILWSESTSTYNFQITCIHDSTPGGFTLLNFSSSIGQQKYLFSYGSSGSDSLNLSISNLQSTSFQCQEYLKGDFTQPILNVLGDSNSQSVIVYSSAEVVIYGFNSDKNNFVLLQKITEQFFNQKLFSPLQGLYIFENSIVLYTQLGKFSITSYINNQSTIQSQQIISTSNFSPIQINMQNIQGAIIDKQNYLIYIFGQSIQQINLKSQSVNYIITNLPIPFIRQTQSVPKTVYDYSQNIFASTSSDGLSLSYDLLTGEILSIFLHPDYKLSMQQPQGITLCLIKGILLCVAYNDQSFICYHAINMMVYFKQIFFQSILRLYNDDINGLVLINSLDYLQIVDPFNAKIINTINKIGQFYFTQLYTNLNLVTVSQNGYVIRYNYPNLTIKYQTDSSSLNTNNDKIVGIAFGASQEGYSILYFKNGLSILYDEQLNPIQSNNDNVQYNRCGIVQEGQIYLYYSCVNQDGTIIFHGIVQPFYNKIKVVQFPITYSDVVPQYNKVIFSMNLGSYGGSLVFADTLTQLAQSQFGSRSAITAFDIDQNNQRVFISNTLGDIMLSHFTPNTYFYIKRSENSVLQKLLLINSQQKLVSLSNIITVYDYFSQTIYKYNDRVHKQSIVNALIVEDVQLIISYNYDTSNNLQAWNYNTDQSQSLVGHTQGINGVQFMGQQNMILSYDKAGQIIVWSYNTDLSKIKILQKLSQNQNNEIINLFLFTKYTNIFISLDITGNVFMTNFLNGSIVKAFKVSNMNAMVIDELYDRIFLYGSSIEVYSAITGVKVQEIIGFDNQVQQVIFKNNYIIAYGTVNIQSIARDSLAVLFASQFKKNIYSLTVLINFVGMVGNNVDSTIEVWDYTSGVMLSEIKNFAYPQNLVSIFHDEQSQLFIVQNVDRYLFTVTPYNSFIQQKDFLFAQMTSSYIKSYVFDFYSNILIVCNDDAIISWQYYAYVGFQGSAVIIPSESLIMSTYHSKQDIITYADLNQNIWQASQNQLFYKLQLQFQPKQIVLHTNTHLLTDGINLYSYDSNFKLVSQLQIYPYSIYLDETISFIFVQTYSYQIIQILINTSNSELTFVNIYSNHKSRIVDCIINTIYQHIITFDVTGQLAINNYNNLKPIAVPQQNNQIIRDVQIDFQFQRLITCSQDQTSIIFSYNKDAPISVLKVLQQSSSVVQGVIDTQRLQILIWTDLQLAIQVRNLNSTNLDLIKYIYGPGDYQTQMKLSQQWSILAIFNQFQVNLHDRNANDAIINSLRMPSLIYNITDIQFISNSLLLIRSKAQLNLVSFSYNQISIQKSFSMVFPTLLSLSYSNQLIINIKGINLYTVFNYTFPYSSDPTHTDYSQCYTNLQRTSSYFQLSQDLSTQSISFQKVSQTINSIVLNIQMDDEQPFFFVQKSINLGGTTSFQQLYVYDKKQSSQKDRVDLQISSFEQFNMPTLTIKNFNWRITNQTNYKFNKNTQNIIFVNSTFQDNILGSQFIIDSVNSLMIDNMEIINLQLSQMVKTQLRTLQMQQSQISSLFQITNTNIVYIKNLCLINVTIENTISIFQISQVQQIIIQNLTIQNVSYFSSSEQSNIWSTLFSIQNSQNIQINSVSILNCTPDSFLSEKGLKFSNFVVFYMNANKNLTSINLNAYNNQNLMIFDISQTYLKQGLGYIQVVNDTISFQNMIVSQCSSVLGLALNKIQTSYFELTASSFLNNTCLNSYGCAFDITETKFIFNQCVFLNLQSQYGGAISIKNSPQSNFIFQSNFQSNSASQGGSIYLYSSNLEIISTVISQNKAEVGGAIRYLNLIPDFVIKKQYLNNSLSENKIEKNQAKIFGQNIGSYPRKIQITSMNEGVDYKIISQNQSQIEYQIEKFMSGGNINFNIKIYDEEDGVVNLNLLLQSSQDLQYEFESYQIECISLNPKIIQINGNKAAYNQTDISFTFQNIQLISNPQTSSVFYIQNNIIQIQNPQNATQFLLAPLQIKINVNFRQCEIGEIIIKSTQNTPSYCELCPVQKYSLITPDPNSQSEQVCKLCPDSCSYCQGNTIILKNGYWRENNQTDNIVSCVHNPDNCQGESTSSIQNCKQGYIGPLCETCDLYGKVWKQKYMNKQQYECMPCHDSSSQTFIYLSSVLVGCLYIIFGVKAARQMTLIKSQSYYLRMIGLASIGNSESTDKSDIYLKFYMHFIQISSIAYQIYQPQFLNVLQVGIGTPIDFLKFSADCRSVFTEEFLPHAYGRVIWSQILSVSYFLFLISIYYLLHLFKYFKRFERSLITTGIIFIFLFLQPNIISGLVQIISCRDIGGTQYLIADVTLKCYTLEYYSYIFILFLPLFLIWAIVIPLIGIIILKRKITILNYCSVRLSYGLLYSEYKKQQYYWEFIKINLKLIIILISSFYSQQIQFKNTLSTMILFCYLMLSIFKAPYINVNFNRTDQYLCITLIICLQLNLLVNTSENDIQLQICSLLLYALHYIFSSFLIIQVLLGKTKRILFIFGEKYPAFKSNFSYLYLRLGVNSYNKMRTFKNWAKAIELIATHLLKRNNVQNNDSISQVRHSSIFFSKHQRKSSVNQNQISNTSPNTQLNYVKQPKRGVSAFKLVNLNEEKKRDENESPLNIFDEPTTLYTNRLTTNNPKQEESAQQIFTDRVKKKQIGRKDLQNNYQFKTKKNSTLFHIDITDLFCKTLSPLDGSCIQCNPNFTLSQSQGLCVSDCDQNLYFETDSQSCVPSCEQNEFGDSNQGACQEIYQCPILVDLGQDFHSGLASQIIVDDTNQIIISISNADKNIKLWNQVNGILKTTFSGHTQPVLKIYLLQDSNQLLSFSSSGEIFYWNYSTGVLDKQQVANQGQLTALSYVNLEYGLITLYGYQGEFYIYNIQTQIFKKYVGHTNLVLNSIIINPSSFITYSLDKSIILWSESTSTYNFQITCIHDSTPGGFTLLTFSSSAGQQKYLFSFGSSGSDSLNLSISNLQSTSFQCQEYLKGGDFTQPILNVLGDSSSQSVIAYSSAEVLIYGFNSDSNNFVLLQKISEQFFNQKLFFPLQGLYIFENSIVLYTQLGKFCITSYINNQSTIQSQQIISTSNFSPIQINMYNIQGAFIDQSNYLIYIFGQSIQQIDLKSQSVNYIITNLPIPFIRQTQSVPKTVYDYSQNIFASTSSDGLSLSYDLLTGEILSIFQHPDYKLSIQQPQGITLCLVKGQLLCVAYNDLSFICYHAINMMVYFKQIFFQKILKLYNDDVNGFVLINSLDYLQIVDPFNAKIINTINQTGQYYFVQLYPNLNLVTVSQNGYVIRYNYPNLTIKYQTDSSKINTNKDKIVGIAFGSNEDGYSILYFQNGLSILYDEQLNPLQNNNDNVQINRCGIVQEGQIYLYYSCLNQDGTIIFHGIAQPYYSKIIVIQFPITYSDVIPQYNKVIFTINLGSYGGSLVFADTLTQLAQSQFGSRSAITDFEIDANNQRVFISNTLGDIMLSHFTPNTYYYIKGRESSILQKLLLINSQQKLVSLSNTITIYDYFSQTIYKQLRFENYQLLNFLFIIRYNDKVHKQSIVNALIIEDIQLIISFNYDISNNLLAWNFNTDQSQSLVGHTQGVNGVQFMETLNIILSYDKAGQIIAWSYNTNLSKIKILQRLSQNSNNEIINLFLFTKYTNLFISLDITGNVFMTNFLNGSIVKGFKVSNMNSMVIDELYDRIFLYGSSIEVYSAITGVKVQEIIGFDNQVQQVIFKNNYIIAYGTVNIQSIARDSLVVLFASQFKKKIYSLTVLINFVGIVGNNVDSTIEVWDYTSGVMLSEIKNFAYPQNLVSIFHDEQSQLFIVQNVDRQLFTVTPYFNSYVQQKDFLFAQMTPSYIKSYVFDFYSNILIVCNDDTIIAWQYYAYVGFQGQAVIIPSESLIMSTYHLQQDIITYADLNQNIWQASQNQLFYKLQLSFQPKQIILHTNTHLVTDGIQLYSYDSDFKLISKLQIYPFSIYFDETISFIFVQTYSYQIIQILLNTSNSELTFVNIYSNHKNRIVDCIINTIYSHIITFDVTGYLAINNYNNLKPIAVPQQNSQIIRDVQIDFQFQRLITCSQDQTSIIFSYNRDAPISVLKVLQQSSSVVQAVIDTQRLQILIWTDLQLAIQVRNLNSTNLDLIKQIYGPGDYQTQMKLSQEWSILAIFNQFQVNLHDRNANDAIINSLRMPSLIYNITDIQFISNSLLLIRSKAQLNLVSFSYNQISIQKSFQMTFPKLLSLSYSNQLIINIKGINLYTVFNYTFPYSSDPTHIDYSQCYTNLQRTSSYFQLSQDLTTQIISFQKVSQTINTIVLNILMDDEQPFFFVQKSINLGGTTSLQQLYVYNKKQSSQKDRINLQISSFEQFNMPTLTIKNFNWRIINETNYTFNNNTQNIIFVNSTFQDNIQGSQFIIDSVNSLLIDNMEIINLQLSQTGKTQLRTLQIQQSQIYSLFQITNTNMVYIKNLSLINMTIENSISIFQISQAQNIIIQNLTIKNVSYISTSEQQNIWSTLFSIQNSQNIQINSVSILNCALDSILSEKSLTLSNFVVFYMNANKNLTSINLSAQNNQNLMIFDISQTYLKQGLGYIQVVNDTISFQDMIVSQCSSILGQALNKIQASYFELSTSSFLNNQCLNSYGCAFDITETKFNFTKSIFLHLQSQYGGAISIKNSPLSNFILESTFQQNVASQGGSIYLYSSNLEIISTVISQNNAEVGGAIRYLNLIPDFVIKKQYQNSQNKIEKNQAKIFGQNIGSYPRNMQITRMNEGVDYKIISQNQSQIEYQIYNFMSGGNINFNIKIYDEENGVVNLTSLQQSSQDLQNEFESYQIECVSLNTKIIQINGNKAAYNQTDISFTFQNIQIISNPQTSSVFYIQNNIIQIQNPQNATQFLLAPLQIKININFRQCEIGEIIIKSTQNTPSYCELCPLQKYSLITPDPNSQSEQKYMNKQQYECIPCQDSSSQAFIYLSSVFVGCLYIAFGVKAARQMTLIKAQSYYLRMIGLASIGNSESTDKSDIYLKFYMHFIQISSIAYQIYQPQFLKVLQVGIGTPIDFLKFSADCRSVFTEEFMPHAYGRIIWSQVLSHNDFILLFDALYFQSSLHKRQFQSYRLVFMYYTNYLSLIESLSQYVLKRHIILDMLIFAICYTLYIFQLPYNTSSLRLGVNSYNKMRTFKNWAKAIDLIATHLLKRNNVQNNDSISQVRHSSIFFSKHQRKSSVNSNQITNTSPNIQLNFPKQPKRGASTFKLININEEKKRDENESPLNLFDEPTTLNTNRLTTNNAKQEESAQEIFTHRVKKKQIGRKDLQNNYQFKTNKNSTLFHIDIQENE
ncbi:hypothetical protein ABPG74_015300 [Tetrahymena malaccensis]